MTLREEVARKIAWAMYGGYHGKPKSIDYAAADAILPLILSKAAEVARGYKSSLRPGSKDRLHGHQEAAQDIARQIEMLGEG